MLVNKNAFGFNKQQNDVFYALLYLSGGFRGRDGTGVVVVDNLGNVEMAKAALPVDAFAATNEFRDLNVTAFRTGWAMFGHNRAATRGSVTDENSHPFVVDDNIILVHNGTFNGDHKKLKDTEVDSEAIAHMLAETDTTENALRKVNAAFALMWYNVDKKELNVIRNSQRPLWYMETDDSYLYSSEEAFLLFVKEKYKLKCKRLPFEIKEASLSKFALNEDKSFDIACTDLDIAYYKHNPVGGSNATAATFSGWDTKTGKWKGYQNSHVWGMHDEDNDGFLSPNVVAQEVIIDTRSGVMAERIATALGSSLTPTTNGLFEELALKYFSKTKLRVLVNDLVEADDHPKTTNFVLLGRTMDEHRLHVAIPMKEKSINEIIQLSSDAIFEVDYSGTTWRRVEAIDVNSKEPLADWKGLCLVHGTNPVPIYLAEGNECAC